MNEGPAILKLDAGPGQIASPEAVLAKREALFERGLIKIIDLPNSISVQQEMDALYSSFKSATYVWGEKVVQQKSTLTSKIFQLLSTETRLTPSRTNGSISISRRRRYCGRGQRWTLFP